MNKLDCALRRLRTAAPQAFLACTGAGAGLQQLLWSLPGTSDFLVGAAFPYAERETVELLGFAPDRYCDEDTALELAMAAYMRAFRASPERALGLGLTAVVASEREHRGAHRVYIATVSRAGCWLHSAILPKGVGVTQRRRDGALSDLLGLNALLHALGLEPVALGDSAEADLERTREDGSARARALFMRRPFFAADGTRRGSPPAAVHLPGTFNPPHVGHREIAARLQSIGRDCLFSVCVDPPHKEALSLCDLLERAQLLQGLDRLFSAGDPLYLDKARRWRCDFAIGTDALQRMLDPSWGIAPQQLLQSFAELGTHFYVAERVLAGERISLESCRVPPQFGHLFSSLGCCSEMSSTAMRHGMPASPGHAPQRTDPTWE